MHLDDGKYLSRSVEVDDDEEQEWLQELRIEARRIARVRVTSCGCFGSHTFIFGTPELEISTSSQIDHHCSFCYFQAPE
jgi:hypothetical protein